MKIKLEKSRITAFIHMKNKTKKYLELAVTFSQPVMESTLKSSADGVFGKGYATTDTTDSYIRIKFNLGKLHENECCIKLKEFLKQLDDEIVKAQIWTKTLEKTLSVK